MMPEFGVIGLGSVGWAVIHGLSDKYSYAGYNIAENYDWNEILDTKILFVCVGTPEGDDGRLDCSQVDNVLSRLSEDNYSGGCNRKKHRKGRFFSSKFLTNIGKVLSGYMDESPKRGSTEWTFCFMPFRDSNIREIVDLPQKDPISTMLPPAGAFIANLAIYSASSCENHPIIFSISEATPRSGPYRRVLRIP